MAKKLFFLFLFVLFSVSSAFSDPLQPKRHEWDVAFQASYFQYKEPSLSVEDKGVLYGVSAAYTYHDGVTFSGDFRFSYGNVDYSSGNTGSLDNIEDYILEYRFWGGYDFVLDASPERATLLTPYFGFGYRYLNDDSGGKTSTTGALGYERESNYFYSPIGLKTTLLYPNWSFELAAEYDIFWWGLQRSHLSDASPLLADIENEQNSGYGVRGSLKVVRKLQNLSLFLEPYAIYWNIDKSEVSAVTTSSGYIIGVGWEPDNESTEWGLKIGIRF